MPSLSESGKRELDNFIDPEKTYPVIATTSKLMSTGVDAQTCKLIVLDQNIKSMTLFKQIIGRGTRLREDLGKSWFTILDFKRATELFADPAFDGDPAQIYVPGGGAAGPSAAVRAAGDGAGRCGAPEGVASRPGGTGNVGTTGVERGSRQLSRRSASRAQFRVRRGCARQLAQHCHP